MNADQFTIEERMIDVGDDHRLYVQEWGNKSSETILYLHGGPGSGCSDKAKALFNPARHRVIFFDQRGCGRSTPYGTLENNTTDHLIDDINTITKAFSVDRFAIIGGSWGSCLALTYAIRHPDRIIRLVLRGIFTGRRSEIDFLDKGGLQPFFPDIWEVFIGSVPAEHRTEPRTYHLPRILGPDSEAQKKSAYAYSRLEGSVAKLDDRTDTTTYEDFDPAPTTIECHYLANDCFLPEDHIMRNAEKLHMPVHLVQGRYDAVCPPRTAYELYTRLPNATLTWTMAGHSGNDRANWEAVRAILMGTA